MASSTVLPQLRHTLELLEPRPISGVSYPNESDLIKSVIVNENNERSFNDQDAPLLDSKDLERIWRWNSFVPSPNQNRVHDVFAERAKARPSAPAVDSWDGCLSYSELDHHSSVLAYNLNTVHGISHGDTVFVLFEKSLWTSVAILASIKAGSMFVLLNPSLPLERLKHLTRNVQASLVLSSPSQSSLAKTLCSEVIIVNKAQPSLQLRSNEVHKVLSPQRLISSTSKLYALFTSGSTGNPKLIHVSHSNLLSALEYQESFLQICQDTRYLDFSSYSFDVSIHHMLATFLAGACLCIPSEVDRGNRLEAYMAEQKVNFAHMTPSSTRLIDPQNVPSLKILVVIGERVSPGLVQRWAPHLTLINAYGPAECSIISTLHRCTVEDSPDVPIGSGFGCSTWIVNSEDATKLLPIGHIGELLIEGPIVGLGYFGNAEESANVFVRSPKWLRDGYFNIPGRDTRLYKTGDLARYDQNGKLYFVGRKDLQVKIRGQRVELGEIERHIQAIMTLASVVVVELILNDSTSASQLLAFVKLPSIQNVSSSSADDEMLLPASEELYHLENDLRNQLMRVLPPYMVPSCLVALRFVPLTPSGKVDRRAIHSAGRQLLARVSQHVPTTRMSDQELALRDLWSINLGRKSRDISLRDNYFMLGGDSISALKLISSARHRGIHMNVVDILGSPMLRDMARNIRKGEDSHQTPVLSPFELIEQPRRTTAIHEAAKRLKVMSQDIEDIYPCTPMQEGLLSLTERRPGAYTVRERFAVRNGTSLSRVNAAWSSVVRASKVLRTRTIYLESMGMMQIVLKPEPRVNIINSAASDIPKLERSADETPASGMPLFRLDLIKSSSSPQMFLQFTAHHAICDEWQTRLLLDQFEAAYHGCLEPSPYEFASFVQHLTNQDQNLQSRYWLRQLAEPTPSIFPDTVRKTQSTWASQTVVHQIRAKWQGTTPAFTMSTKLRLALALLLASHTNSDDIVFGLTLTGRNAPISGVERILGPTLTTVPFRVKLERSKTISQFLDSLHRQALEMVPFEQTGLQNISKLCSAAEAACGFQTLLVIQQASRDSSEEVLQREEASGEDLVPFGNTALFLECTIRADGGVDVRAAFDGSIMTHFQVERMVWQLDHVLSELQTRPEQSLSDVSILSPQDINQLALWQPQTLNLFKQTLHGMFLTRCLESPESAAIHSWDGKLTYASLDEASSKLALFIEGLSLPPDSILPQLFEKSALAIVCELAVLKAGGACLTLDSNHPVQRLSEIIVRTGTRYILVSQQNKDILQIPDVQNIEISWSMIKSLPGPSPHHIWHNKAKSPAFIVFTSGSTGKPKGIVLDHQALATTAQVHASEMNITMGARVLHFASPSFDVSIYEVWMALTMGACICVPSESERLNRLAGFVQEARTDMAMISPTALNALDHKQASSLKTIVLVGEPIPLQVVSMWESQATVMNGYGPGECTFCSTTVIDAAIRPVSTVGSPTGCRFWIVDINDRRKLAPIGAVGEIVIQGPTLARGYLGDPEKTDEAFETDAPWMALIPVENYKRSYYSGDLGRYNADGSVVYVGRVDAQVKLRGQRIELGEVNHHLHFAFSGSALSEIIHYDQKPELTAFVLIDGQCCDSPLIMPPSTKIPGLRVALNRLESALPSYMIPTIFLPLSRIPKTTSGKFDRKALRETAASFTRDDLLEYRHFESGDKSSPTTPIEIALRDIWAALLNVSPEVISTEDSFFHVGANSVDAMRLVSIAREFGLKISVSTIFKHPRLSYMAKACEALQEYPEMTLALAPPFALMRPIDVEKVRLKTLCASYSIPVENIEDTYPATFDQIFEFLSNHSMYARFQVSSQNQLDRMIESWNTVVRNNSVLRTVFVPKKSSTLAVVLTDVNTIVDESLVHVENLAELVETDSGSRASYGCPLFKLFLIKTGSTNLTLVLKMNHAIYDGYSLANIWDSWQSAYNGDVLKQSWPFQSILYSREVFSTEASFSYWRNLLRSSTPTFLPTSELPRGKLYQHAALSISKRIENIKPPPGCVTDALLKAGWCATLHNLSCEEDVVFCQITNGRRVGGPGIEDAIGPLYQVIPVRFKFSSSMRVIDLCQALQDQDSESMMHECLSDQDIWACADWPQDMLAGSIFDHVKGDIESSLVLDGVRCGPDVIYNEGEQPELNVYVQSQESTVNVTLVVPGHMDIAVAQKALDEYCTLVELFSREPDRLII